MPPGLTRSTVTRLLCKLAALALVGLALRVGWVAWDRQANMLLPTGWASLCLVWAYFLFREQRRARRAFAFALVLLALIIPLGVINPFAASDLMAQGATPPGLDQILVWLLPLEIGLLLVAYFIDDTGSKRTTDLI